MDNLLKADIKETINMETLNYLLKKDGTKIPTNDLDIPIDDYIC